MRLGQVPGGKAYWFAVSECSSCDLGYRDVQGAEGPTPAAFSDLVFRERVIKGPAGPVREYLTPGARRRTCVSRTALA